MPINVFSTDVAIGATTALGTLHVKAGSAGTLSINPTGDTLVLEGDGHTGMTIVSAANDYVSILMGDEDGELSGRLRYNNATHTLELWSDGTQGISMNSAQAVTFADDVAIGGVLNTSTVTTFGSTDATPTVGAGNVFKTADADIAISDFDDGVTGQEIILFGQNSASTCSVTDGGNLLLSGNWTAALNASLKLVYTSTAWLELSRSAN